MEPSEIRKRVLGTLEQARRRVQIQREESDRATKTWETLHPAAAASWKIALNVLRAEGHHFSLQTPSGMLRVVSDRSAEDYVEVLLDTSQRPPAVLARTRLSRGRRVIDRETIVADGDRVPDLTEERLLHVLLTELEPFVER